MTHQRLEEDPTVNLVSASQWSRLLKEGNERTFCGFLRRVDDDECNVVEEGVKELESHLCSAELPEAAKSLLHDFQDVFPADLPAGLPPIRQGHEFKIDLEDNVPPVHRPLYKLSPLELDEAKK